MAIRRVGAIIEPLTSESWRVKHRLQQVLHIFRRRAAEANKNPSISN